MTLRVFHLCPYNFRSSDPVVVGSEVDGGTSLAGIQDVVAIDGGGAWQWSLSNATFGGRKPGQSDLTLSWRALTSSLNGGQPAVFLLCDRLHQPVGPGISYPHDQPLTFDAGASTVAAVANGQTGGLNATIIDVAFVGVKRALPGMRFTHVHPTWKDRCYDIKDITDNPDGTIRLTFIPPVRGGIAVGDALDFDNPRCIMKRSSPPTNAIDPVTLQTTAQITLVEYMVDPDVAPYP